MLHFDRLRVLQVVQSVDKSVVIICLMYIGFLNYFFQVRFNTAQVHSARIQKMEELGSGTDDNDVIDALFSRPFGCRNLIDKREVIKEGRLTSAHKFRSGNRVFRPQWYKDIYWLCGSKTRQKLYCWPCFFISAKGQPILDHKRLLQFKKPYV